ncbi:hypothetical protein [Oricola sp.]|uniref:hypothetical protein n=1 Tax=Oricola sp. TaxID=1979950 RepID=UPI0025DDC5A6|nr:hypothetical protein [Oricola sp.]MCI5075545.1 DUF1833 domain-containing protein [Oricola sp.]
MARSIPLVTRQSLEDYCADNALAFFVELTHEDVAQAVRLVTDGVDYVWDGETWHKSWFEIALLTDSERPPETRFSFPNVDRSKTMQLEHLKGAVQVSFWVISSGYFDLTANPRTVLEGETVETAYQALYLDLIDVEVGPADVSGMLRGLDVRSEIWPALWVTEALFPGVYLE